MADLLYWSAAVWTTPRPIPPAALPEAVKGSIAEQPYVIQERPWLSHYVASSISRLRRALPEWRSLTATDIFADIAINGSGQSVALLRKHKIGPWEIDQILTRNHIDLLRA